MRIVFIISAVMLVVGLLANILAKILEIKYKNKMDDISKNRK